MNTITHTKRQQYTYYAIATTIWTLAALFYFYEFSLQVSTNVMKPELMAAFHLSAAQFGLLGASYFYTYAFMQIPVGMLVDRYGPHILLTVGSAICAIASYIFAQTGEFWAAQISRALIGFCGAFALVSCFKLTSNWFPARGFATIAGLVITIGMLGAVFGEAPLAFMVEKLGWRESLEVLGIAGGILSLLILLVVRDKPRNPPFVPIKPATPHAQLSVFAGLRQVIRNTQIWLLAIYGSLMFAPTAALSVTWGVAYLVEDYHISRTLAASIITFLFFGWAVGCPLLGAISDYIGRRKPIMVVGAIVSLITISTIIYLPPMPTYVVDLLFFMFGFFSSGFFIAFTVVRELTPQSYSATALGFMNTLNSLGGAIFPPLIGKILDLTWKGGIHGSERLYTAFDYKIALGALPISLIAAIIILPFIKETYCKSVAAV